MDEQTVCLHVPTRLIQLHSGERAEKGQYSCGTGELPVLSSQMLQVAWNKINGRLKPVLFSDSRQRRPSLSYTHGAQATDENEREYQFKRQSQYHLANWDTKSS